MGSKRKKNWIRSEWAVGLGATLFGFLLTIGYDFLKQKPVLNTIGNILRGIWNFIISFLNFDIKVWWILCFIVLVIITVLLIAKFSKNNENSGLPKFLEYKSQWLKGYRFSWYWKKGYDGGWNLANFKIHCPKCDTPMASTQYYDKYNCPRCDYSNVEAVSCNKAEQVVIDNANRMREEK